MDEDEILALKEQKQFELEQQIILKKNFDLQNADENFNSVYTKIQNILLNLEQRELNVSLNSILLNDVFAFIPDKFIGSVGLVYDFKGNELLRLGSGHSIEVLLWAYSMGFPLSKENISISIEVIEYNDPAVIEKLSFYNNQKTKDFPSEGKFSLSYEDGSWYFILDKLYDIYRSFYLQIVINHKDCKT